MEDYDDEMAEAQREILEEGAEYAENWQRSEEDGWFYSDNDESEVYVE